jgi:hypothetical protein
MLPKTLSYPPSVLSPVSTMPNTPIPEKSVSFAAIEPLSSRTRATRVRRRQTGSVRIARFLCACQKLVIARRFPSARGQESQALLQLGGSDARSIRIAVARNNFSSLTFQPSTPPSTHQQTPSLHTNKHKHHLLNTDLPFHLGMTERKPSCNCLLLGVAISSGLMPIMANFFPYF